MSISLESQDRITPPASDLHSSSPLPLTEITQVPQPVVESDIPPVPAVVEGPCIAQSSVVEVVSVKAPLILEVGNAVLPPVLELQSPAPPPILELPSPPPVLELNSMAQSPVLELQSPLPPIELLSPPPTIPVSELQSPPAFCPNQRSSPPPVPPAPERRHRSSVNRRVRPPWPAPPVNSTRDAPELQSATSASSSAVETADRSAAGAAVARQRRPAVVAFSAAGPSESLIYRRATSSNGINASTTHQKRMNRQSNPVRSRTTTTANLPEGYGNSS